MSPKRDSPPDSMKESSLKREPSSLDDSIGVVLTAPSAAPGAIPPLPHTKRDLFKVASNVLSDAKTKSEKTTASSGMASNDGAKKDQGLQGESPIDVIGKYTSIKVRIFSNEILEFVFPLSIRSVMNEINGDFVSFDELSCIVSDRADDELHRRGIKTLFVSPLTHYGSKLDLRIVSFDEEEEEEFLLTDKNYKDIIVSTFAIHGKLFFNLHTRAVLVANDTDKSNATSHHPRFVKDEHSMYARGPDSRNSFQRNRNLVAKEELPHLKANDNEKHFSPSSNTQLPKIHKNNKEPLDDDKFFRADNLIREEVTIADLMSRAAPPYGNNISVKKNDDSDGGLQNCPGPNSHSRSFTQGYERNGYGKIPMSPIRVYGDDECLIRDASKVIPFSQESKLVRVDQLQTSARLCLPNVTDIPKLLKSHNVALSDSEDVLSWYLRFNDFALMLGIYICPPNAMDKNSEMGKEWDSGSLPHAFYDKRVQSERILSHILRSPKFIPDKYKDELLLNPKPYNFLRLFIALHACSGSDLSSMVVHRPGPMKASQSLASYAYSWVKYFLNEANINGVPYSKYRQYAYFIDGLHPKFAPIKKFLEQDFMPFHDRHDNIPISLELNNLPATIASLAQIHGISLANSSTTIQQVSFQSDVDNQFVDDGKADDDMVLMDSIQKVGFKVAKIDKPMKSSVKRDVQCWLCDGAHAFRQCDQLKRLQSICAQRPNLSKYLQQIVSRQHENSDLKRLSVKAILESYQGNCDDAITCEVLERVAGSSDTSTGDDAIHAIITDPFVTHDEDDCYIGYDELHHSAFFEDDGISDDYIRTLQFHDDMMLYPSHQPSDVSFEDLPSVKSMLIPSHADVQLDLCQHAQVDSGADRTTTSRRHLIHDFRLPDPLKGDRTSIGDAGHHTHKIMGYGFFHICSYHIKNNVKQTLRVPCMYIPTIPSTLVNFLDIPHCSVIGKFVNKKTAQAYQYVEVTGTDGRMQLHKIPLICVHNTRLYTAEPLIAALPSSDMTSYALTSDEIKRIVSDEPTRLLWHSRLGHLHYRCLSSLHKSVIGLPLIKDTHVVDKCPSCLEAKLRRSPRGHGSVIDKATEPFQLMSANWGFICQHSEDTTRVKRLSSYYGDTSYLIFTCAYTGSLVGVCGSSKAVPSTWLDTFFYKVSRNLKSGNTSVLVDRGSELGRSLEFKTVVERYRYKLHTCGPDKSSMNGLGERPHSTVGDAIRTMLHSASLPIKFWNFAFHHFIRLYNLFPHGKRPLSPFEMLHGRKPDVSHLRIFGSRVYIRPPGKRPSKLDLHAIKGIFLGYTSTLKQIYYLECSTNKVKIASHAKFDEGMNDLPLDQLPPFAIHIRKALGHSVPADLNEVTAPQHVDIFCSDQLFPVTISHVFHVLTTDIANEYDTLGFVTTSLDDTSRPYISDIIPKSTASQFPRWRSTLIGAFILSVDGVPVYSQDDVSAALSAQLVSASGQNDVDVNITFAIDKNLRKNVMSSMTHSALQADQICRIASVLSPPAPSNVHDIHDSGEYVADLPILDDLFVDYLDDLLSSPSLVAQPPPVIRKLISQPTRLTRRLLLRRPDWSEWLAAEHKQLDVHRLHNMFGKPCPRPARAIVLRAVWNYTEKWNGDKKARMCCDGRVLRLKGMKLLEAIYTSCISQTGMKIFFALSALLGYVIVDLDAVNAYAQGGRPYDTCYLEVDSQYRDWYFNRFGIRIPDGHVLPVLRPLQGHPDAGEVWQTKVNAVLTSFGFKSTTHEPCLYRGTFLDHDILICRQVDDMLLAGTNRRILQEFAIAIGKHIHVTIGDGLSSHYNGIDILQTREGIKIYCSTYLTNLSAVHGWDTTSKKPLEPIHPDAVKLLESSKGPPIDSPEGKELAQRNALNYRGVVGEIVYAYILCCPDFGYAVTLLSRFNTCPAQCHYDAAKRCLKSLLRSPDEGIWYWRLHPIDDLPPLIHSSRPLEDFELDFPLLSDPFLASATVDTSYGPQLHCRRSIGGSFIYLGLLGLIAYVGKLQPLTTDSTCASEFIQYVHTGKRLKFVRSILIELNVPQHGPSPIYGDNMAAIMMANNTRPTDRTRHLDIRWFAIQEWIHLDGDIILLHIPGILNPSDAQTKALSFRLHHRHMSRAMGALGSPFLSGRFHLVSRNSVSIKALFLVSN